MYLRVVDSIVTLSSSADNLCPGDGVVFTCVTDTGRLVWDIMHSSISYHSTALLNKVIQLDTVFNTTLLSITGNIYHSTATAAHVPVSYNGTTVECNGVVSAEHIIPDKAETILVVGEKQLLLQQLK